MFSLKIRNNFIVFTLLLLLASAVFGFNSQAYADQHSVSYIAQLNSADIQTLNSLGKNIQPEFQSVKNMPNYFSFDSSYSAEQIKQLLGDQLLSIELNQTYAIGAFSSQLTPNDPGFTKNSDNIDKQWGLVKANFLKAWEITTGSEDVVVAIIDTGVDASHEDFRGTKFVRGFDIVEQSSLSRGANSDDNGHGTLVAGIIGATVDNKKGIAGAVPSVSLMAVKALNQRGTGSSARVSEAIRWAADNGADIINLSLGGPGFSHDKTLSNSIAYAFNKGVVIIAAAGNDAAITGGNLDEDPVFPICHDNDQNMIIGVTALDQRDLKPSFANYGKASVDVAAPGRRILSTINHDPATGAYRPDAYAYASGTSLAVPFVSAQAALLKALYPFASNGQIRDRIITTAEQVDKLNLSQCGSSICRGYLGGGRINVFDSLRDNIDVVSDKDVVRLSGSDEWYYINGGKRQLISSFVRQQRFAGVSPRTVSSETFELYPEGSYAPPLDRTLVKVPNNPTIFYISDGVKLPITFSVFQLRNLNFSEVVVLPDTEVDSWVEGSFLTPPDGTLVRTPNNPTVYWVVDQTLHPINSNFYNQKGLNIFPVIYMGDSDIEKLPIGESFIL